MFYNEENWQILFFVSTKTFMLLNVVSRLNGRQREKRESLLSSVTSRAHFVSNYLYFVFRFQWIPTALHEMLILPLKTILLNHPSVKIKKWPRSLSFSLLIPSENCLEKPRLPFTGHGGSSANQRISPIFTG